MIQSFPPCLWGHADGNEEGDMDGVAVSIARVSVDSAGVQGHVQGREAQEIPSGHFSQTHLSHGLTITEARQPNAGEGGGGGTQR